uniref:No apical meristem-associated C-terminal domain-containing protein n=1 Tax=Brassica oleracea var. oleracea TaxID=109376 RepID=A0A0D3DPA3_BRAOL
MKRLPLGLQELKKLVHLRLDYMKRLKSVSGILKLSSLRKLQLLESKMSLDMSLMEELQLLEHLQVLNISIKSSLVVEKLLYAPRTSRSNNKPGESAMSVNIIPFQKLESLLLHNLATLKNIYWEPLPFPCLKTIHVTECPELRKLPLDSQSVFRVEEFVIKYKDEEWFERVEWDDEATRLRFLPFLKFFGPEWQVQFCLAVALFSASPKLACCEKRDGNQCKQRWHKLNEAVCKFSGAYEAKFSLEHAWNELRNDQKWCELATSKTESSSKRRRFADGSHSGASSQVNECDAGVEGTSRPPGVKAAKARGKKPHVEGQDVSDYQLMWSIKKDDLAMKQQLSKMRLLEKLLAKENLADYEEDLKKKLINELIDTPTNPDNLFRRRFRMNKPLFMHIVDRLSNEVLYFREKKDGLGRISLSPLQKCTAAIRVLAYGSAADAVDEYLRLGETTTQLCVEHFVEGIIYLFGDEYLRRPTLADLQRLLDVGEYRGFPGMIGSIDCMHWEWKNCPTAWKGQYSRGSGTLNDINVLDRSPVFDDIIKGPQAVLFAQRQEAVRKDVERAFGVLQARFAIVKNPALFWDKVKNGKIMRACTILHNMIVENERDRYTQYDVSEFQQGEDNGSSHVDLTYSTDIPTNIANQMGVRIRIRDRQMHQQLKDDLVQHI